MVRVRYTMLMASLLSTYIASTEAEAQVYYYPSTSPRVIQQNRVVVGTPSRFYSNNGIRYQSYRPTIPTRYYSSYGSSCQRPVQHTSTHLDIVPHGGHYHIVPHTTSHYHH